ncbi:hypothetical protein ACHAWF_015263 [Thalassiosira exigua]
MPLKIPPPSAVLCPPPAPLLAPRPAPPTRTRRRRRRETRQQESDNHYRRDGIGTSQRCRTIQLATVVRSGPDRDGGQPALRSHGDERIDRIMLGDGKEVEKITLSDYNDKAKLNALFAQKGFQKYTTEEMAVQRKMKEEKEMKDKNTEALRKKTNRVAEMLKPDAQLSQKLRRKEAKEKLRALKNARENYMMVGAPAN